MATGAAEFTFDDKQWQAVLKKINTKWQAIKNRREFGGIISSVVFKDVMDHFENEQGPDGKWDSWSKAYADHLKKMGRGGNKILQFNGKLRQSFTPTNWRPSPDGIIFYNNAKTKSGYPYAKGHDEGGSTKGRPPKRSFMWLSNNGLKSMIDITQKWLAE